MVETRSKETANHVRRVGEMAYLLALKAGLDESEADMIRLASPMHDVGKIGIPEAVLNKPGKLTEDEFELMKAHSRIGYDILNTSHLRILTTAKNICLQHHERWDGAGYPGRLKGEQTCLAARITQLIDVFDALSNRRVYKEAWELKRIIEHFENERGKQFDPKLLELFLANLEDFTAIQNLYPD